MRPHIVSGLCAAGLTILVAAALYSASGPKIDLIFSALTFAAPLALASRR